MFRDKHRYGQDPATVVRSKPRTFNAPLRWKDPARVFVCSWSDFFIEDADEWRDEAWDIMRRTPHITYLLLTKRAENIKDRLPVDWPLRNVWLGVTAEDQQRYDERVHILAAITAPVKFLSVEPMLGPIYLDFDADGLWIICGGESGPGAREMKIGWAASLKAQCMANRNKFFMKQMSGKKPIPECLILREFPGK
jgi:protein gp37